MALDLTRSAWRTDVRFRVAVLVTLLFNGGLLATGSHQRTYDAYVHLFFADHYARDWFSSWEERWYTGFTTVSYPPGVHQLLAIFKGPLGPDGAYAVVQLAGLLLLILGVFRFANLWAGPGAAGWAALGASLSSSLAEVVHVFGQLPTTLALAFLLNAQPSMARWLKLGHKRDLALALAFLASTTAVHHVTTLFGSVFFTGPVIARVILDAFATPLTDEPAGRARSIRLSILIPLVARRLRRMLPQVRRTMVLGTAIVLTLAVVILPYWLWSSRDPIVQVSIPHGSRDNFLANTDAGLVFWLVPWASIMLLVPFAIGRNLFNQRWPLAASTLLLLVLGTGGTTPIPRLLLRGAFDILTLDRFTIWASIAVLPLVGLVVDSLLQPDNSQTSVLRAAFGRRAGTVIVGFCVLVAISSTLFGASLAAFRPMQPDKVEPAPITSFMAKDDHDNWRYLLLGFGDQMAAISAETTALTVDGNYHSARRLPELTSRSVERLEGAKFRGVPGLGSLQQFLANPERYNLKFVFSNDAFYEPLLWSLGWNRLGALDNNVVVWERADVTPLPPAGRHPEIPLWQRVMWGVLPPTAMMSAGFAVMALAVVTLPHEVTVTRQRSRVDRLLASLSEPLYRVARHEKPTVLLAVRFPTGVWTKRRVRAVVGLVVGGVGVLAGLTLAGSDQTPSAVVTDYYEQLDVQNYIGAWELLDPDTRAPLANHLQARSLRDGLLDGYAELDSVYVTAVETAGTEATVSVALEYLTSIETLQQTHTHELVYTQGQWRIVPEPIPTQYTKSGVAIDESLTYSTTSALPVEGAIVSPQDRPLVSVRSASLVEADGIWTALGELTNTDRWPAQVTVTATLRDDAGMPVATAEATTHTMHAVLPGETVPFRIDFTSDTAGEFDPAAGGGLLTDNAVLADATSLEVAVRATVTTHRTERDLAVQGLQASGTDLAASLVNVGTTQVTIPKVLVTSYDSANQILWVDAYFGTEAVRARSQQPIEVDLALPARIETLNLPIKVVGSDTAPGGARLDRFEFDSAGAASVALNVGTFTRTSVS